MWCFLCRSTKESKDTQRHIHRDRSTRQPPGRTDLEYTTETSRQKTQGVRRREFKSWLKGTKGKCFALFPQLVPVMLYWLLGAYFKSIWFTHAWTSNPCRWLGEAMPISGKSSFAQNKFRREMSHKAESYVSCRRGNPGAAMLRTSWAATECTGTVH